MKTLTATQHNVFDHIIPFIDRDSTIKLPAIFQNATFFSSLDEKKKKNEKKFSGWKKKNQLDCVIAESFFFFM